MPVEVTCPHCTKKLRAPTKYLGKTVKCPHCQSPFAVQSDSPAVPDDAPATAASTSASSSVSNADENGAQWHVQTDDNQQYGPVSRAELQQWVKEGRLDDRCQVLRADWDQWRWADEVFTELRGSGSAAASESPVAPSAPAPSPTSTIPSPSSGMPAVASQNASQKSAAPVLPASPVGGSVPGLPAIDPGGSSIASGGAAIPVVGAAPSAAPYVGQSPSSAPAFTANPYQASASPASATAAGGGDLRAPLAATAPWVLLLAIIGFVFAGLSGLFAILAAASALMSGFMSLLFGALLYSAMGFFGCFMPGFLLIKYHSAIKRYLIQDSQGNLHLALKSQQAFWYYIGIYAIVALSLMLIMFLSMFFLGGSIMRFFTGFRPPV